MAARRIKNPDWARIIERVLRGDAEARDQLADQIRTYAGRDEPPAQPSTYLDAAASYERERLAARVLVWLAADDYAQVRRWYERQAGAEAPTWWTWIRVVTLHVERRLAEAEQTDRLACGTRELKVPRHALAAWSRPGRG